MYVMPPAVHLRYYNFLVSGFFDKLISDDIMTLTGLEDCPAVRALSVMTWPQLMTSHARVTHQQNNEPCIEISLFRKFLTNIKYIHAIQCLAFKTIFLQK